MLTEEVRQLVEERRSQLLAETNQMRTEFSSELDAVKKVYQEKKNRELPVNLESVLLNGLRNTKGYLIEEMTKSTDLGTFVDYGYKLVSAILPNLVSEEVCSVQPLKIRSGDVFWIDYLFSNTKGKITAGDSLFNATSGPNTTYFNYSNEVVEQEELVVSGATASGNAAYTPIRGTEDIILYYTIGTADYTVTATVSNGTATFTETVDSTILSGTLDLTSGSYTVIFSGSPVSGSVSLTYQFIFEQNQSLIGQVRIALRQLNVSAREYKLASQYSLDSAYDLVQAQGVELDPLLVAALTSTIRYEIDSIILNNIRSGAGNGGIQLSWSKTVPQYIDVFQHYRSFLVTLVEGHNIIYGATKMVGGNVVIAGLNVMNIIEGMGAPYWEPNSIAEDGSFAGPHVAGVLNKKWKVIKNPAYPADEFVVAHKGGNYLESGYVYAPYRPLYLTPPIPWQDDTIRRGMAMGAGMRMLNPLMFVRGTLTS